MKIIQSLFILLVVTYTTPVFALDAPSITAAAKGPNQINLTWSEVANPGWGYKVEIQSNGDSRYTNWTELNWKNNFGYLPYWVTETGGTQRVYTDPTLAASGWGEAVQSPMYGLRYGTAYNFRVRSYGKTDAGTAVYSVYSNTASATTTTPANIRYVTPGGAGAMNGTSWSNAWPNINSANGVAAGTLVLIGGGSYALDYIDPSNSGTAGTGRIVFQANYGETVTITSTGGTNSAPIFLGTNFVVLDGITTAATTMIGSQPPVMVYGNRNTIANSSFTGLFQGYALIEVAGQYNMFHDVFGSTVGPNQTDGSIFAFNTPNSSYNTIQNSLTTRGQHDQIIIVYGGDYNRIYNNLIDAGGYGTGFQTRNAGADNCGYNLIEGNIFRNVATIHNAYKIGFGALSSYGTFRRNVVYDGWAGATASASKGIEVSRMYPGEGNNNLVYNNTVVNNGGVGIVFWTGVSGNIIRNNLFYNNAAGYTGEGYEYLSDASSNNNTIDHNYFGNTASLSVIKRSYGNDVTLAYADTNYAEFASNFDRSYAVDFIDYANRELYLRSTSSLRDIGAVVVDATWGTLGYRGAAPDLGAYEYSDATGSAPPPSGGGNQNTGGDSSASGGSGCGFVKEDSNTESKGQSGKVADIGIMLLLVFALTAIVSLRKIKYFKGLLFLIMFLFPFSIANAADYYVATNGNDSNPGTIEQPWQHIAWATCGGSYLCPISTNNPNKLKAGDTLYIRGGTYLENKIQFANSGTANSPITITAYPGEKPIVDGGFTAVSNGTEIVPVFDIGSLAGQGSHYITIDGLRITRGSRVNIRIAENIASSNITIKNCEIDWITVYDNSAGIYVDTLYSNVVITNNKIHHFISGDAFRATGILIFTGNNDIVIENNEIYSLGTGISYKHGVSNSQNIPIMRNNIIHDMVWYGINLATNNTLFENNIIYNAGNAAIRFEQQSSICDISGLDYTKIYHNTIVDSARGIWLEEPKNCDGTRYTDIRNNLIYNFTNSEMRGLAVWPWATVPDTSNTIFDHNLIYSSSFSSPIRVLSNYYNITTIPSTVTGSGNIQQAPIFKDYANKDFTLMPNSPGYKAASDGYDMGADTSLPPTPTPDGGGGNTPPPSSGGSGGDSSASGGSGCGFVKDINGKGQGAKGEGLAFAMMLIIIFGGISLAKKMSIFWAQNK